MRSAVVWSLCVGSGCTGTKTPSTSPPETPPTPDPTTTEDTGTPTTDTGFSCENPLVSTLPEDGTPMVFYRTPIEATLQNPDPTAVLTLEIDGGDPWPGTSTVEGATVRFEGDWLSPDTPWLATLTHACGVERFRFTTSFVGSPVEVDLTGKSYAIDLAQGDFIEPAGGEAAMQAVLYAIRLLIGVVEVPGVLGPDTIDFIGGVGYNEQQSICAPTVDLSGSLWEDPFFSVSTPLIVLETEAFALTIVNFTISGAFSPDGQYIQGVAGTGHVDTRSLGEELGLGTDPYAICTLLSSLGVSCLPCDDGLDLCVDIEVENVPGVEVPFTMVEITAEDVNNTPGCL